jgi:hypothetical protein
MHKTADMRRRKLGEPTIADKARWNSEACDVDPTATWDESSPPLTWGDLTSRLKGRHKSKDKWSEKSAEVVVLRAWESQAHGEGPNRRREWTHQLVSTMQQMSSTEELAISGRSGTPRGNRSAEVRAGR